MIKEIIRDGSLIIILLLATTSSSQAGFNVNAGLGLREMYNDNIFFTRLNREYDFITIISPFIGLNYSSPSLDLNLDYKFDFQFYSKHDDLNKAGAIPTLTFKTQVKPSKRIFIDISDIYKRVPIKEKKQITFENLFGERTDSNTFYISPHIEYPLSKTLFMQSGYSFTDVWYEIEGGNDIETHSVFLSFEKRLSINFITTLRYEYIAQRPEKTEDYNSHLGSIAISYKPTANLMVRGEYGQGFFDYSIRDDDKINFWNIDANYTMPSAWNTTIGANYRVSFADSVTAGTYKTNKVTFNLKTGRYIRVGINSYHSIDNYLESSRKDEITGVSFDITKEAGRISSSLNGLWEKQGFSQGGQGGEEANRYSISSTIGYKFDRRVGTGIGYTYNSKDSNIDINDFFNNIIWLTTNFTF